MTFTSEKPTVPGDASLLDDDTQWQCTVCGRVGTVGRCCGIDTRTHLNDAARDEQRRIESANDEVSHERDALRARVKELEEAGDHLAKIVGQKGDPALWVEETECDEAVEGWNKAKKGTP